MVLWQAVFLAASPLVTAPPSNLTRLYYNGSAAKSHSTTTQNRQLRRLGLYREVKSLRHVVMVAKLLDDNKPKTSLKSEFTVF